GMLAFYHPEICFSDPVFGYLEGEDVGKMWRMLCKNAREFSLTTGALSDKGDGYFTQEWTATYRFSQTGRMVVNHVKAYMKVENGMITEHSDAFSFHRWAKQAFGWKGYLFGWTGFFRRRVLKKARRRVIGS